MSRYVDAHIDRVPWAELWPDARDDLLWWLERHHVDPNRTPVDVLIELDRATGEWRIEQYCRPVCIGPGGEPERYVIRRVWRAALPWPTRDRATWIR